MKSLTMLMVSTAVVLAMTAPTASSSATSSNYLEKLGCTAARYDAVVGLRQHYGTKFKYASRYTQCERRINRTRWRVYYSFSTKNCSYVGWITVWRYPRQRGYFAYWISPNGRYCY